MLNGGFDAAGAERRGQAVVVSSSEAPGRMTAQAMPQGHRERRPPGDIHVCVHASCTYWENRATRRGGARISAT
jgi:hypothetical protein